MQARGILADVVTCCSLINALERGGQWQLAEQLFVQMCTASWQRQGSHGPLYRMMEIAGATAEAASPPQETGAAAMPTQAWGSPYPHTPEKPPGARASATPCTSQAPGAHWSAMSSPGGQLTASPEAETGSPAQHSVGFGARLAMQEPSRNMSDLKQQLSNLYKTSSIGDLSADVTRSYSGLYRQPSAQSLASETATSSRLDHDSSLSTPLTSPFKAAPATPDRSSISLPSLHAEYSRMLQTFGGMHMQSPQPTLPTSNAVMPQHSQLASLMMDPSPPDHATAMQIQQAAAHRQDALNMQPTTKPVGAGQAPVLRFMNVAQIAPNRVCCNALLAAYARAKPTQWQKVSTVSQQQLQFNLL